MTRRDRITRRRAKGLWTGITGYAASLPATERGAPGRQEPVELAAYKSAEPMKAAAVGVELKESSEKTCVDHVSRD